MIAGVKRDLPLMTVAPGVRIAVLNILGDTELVQAAAKALAKLIPAQCPFERTIKLFGHAIVSIPPLCKLNPLYDEFVGLRFRALCFLVDRCGEDISAYC